ncbi:hypothetical protein ABW19_dt0210274 [Dactylella cylindrospora]|nr:hypothetical protein ABW19_dt0210274 [Dactylella cylindrospora]
MPPTDTDTGALIGVCVSNPVYPSATRYASEIQDLAQKISTTVLESDLRTLTSFHTRYFRTSTGRDAALWIQKRLRSTLDSNANATVELFEHDWKQPSVIARIPGASNRTIILSSHLDSVNLYLPFFLSAPGADDNASGTSALLSIFSALAPLPRQPLNTIEFHFYAAEEAGFWGSSAVYSSYNALHRSIYSALQFDMIGYTTGTTKAGKTPNIGIVTDYVPSNLIAFLKLLVGEYLDIPPVETTCGYACSDHASAIRYGYPGALLTAGELEYLSNSFSHTGRDTISILDLDHILRFTKLGLAYAYELGYTDLEQVHQGIDNGTRDYTCDLGFPDGWTGSVRRYAAARAADPLGVLLWVLVAAVMLLVAKPWEEVPWLMKMGRRVKRVFRRGRGRYARVAERED